MNTGSGRQAYLDRVRGVAVLIMIEAHVLDSWTRVPDRNMPAFGWSMVLGGFGAPMFLFLAGVSLSLSAQSKLRRGADFDAAWKAVQSRGWQVFGLAFLFRLQSYILTAGYSAMSLLKVDILNIMGPAIALAAMAGRYVRERMPRAVAFAAISIGIAMVTPLVRTTALLDWLPAPVEWYFRPTPGRTNFTLFPWAAFVFAGAAAGEVVAWVATLEERAVKTQLAIVAAGLAIAWVGYRLSFLPSIYVPRSEFWTTSPTFFLLRAGLILACLPLAFFWEAAPWRGVISQWSPLVELGKASLFVYWIHVEMVYGFISRPIKRSLSFGEAIVADLAFSAFLLALVMLKNRLVSARKAPTLPAAGPSPAPI